MPAGRIGSRDSVLGNAGDWVSDRWPAIAGTAGPIILAIGCAWIAIPNSEWSKINWIGSGSGRTVVIGALVSFIGGVASFFQAERVIGLRRRAELAETAKDSIQTAYGEFADQYRSIQQNIIRMVLFKISSQLGLGDSDRISLYGHNGRCFELAGRHSQHPEYAKPGRAAYPDDQGCIGQAWHNGSAFVDNLPDPNQNIRAWAKAVEGGWKIPKKTAEAMRMKSRCLVAKALADDSQNGQRIAVILIESAHINRFGQAALDGNDAVPLLVNLVNLIKIMATFEPNPEYAKNEGY
jgi:hypothetical protein